jgi:hypothetical protein
VANECGGADDPVTSPLKNPEIHHGKGNCPELLELLCDDVKLMLQRCGRLAVAVGSLALAGW